MLTVHQLAKSFALNSLFTEVTFALDSGDRIGLVGPNGCGKTTLLRIIKEQLTADEGHISSEAGTRIGYLSQGFEMDRDLTVGEVIGKASGDISILESELSHLAEALGQRPDDLSLQERYDELLQRISNPSSGKAAKILAGLGLDIVHPETAVSLLSGGQQTRLNLAIVLLGDPQLLLLDEPTNHLDIEMLEWLESWLQEFAGGALIVSHDRTFLDRTVTRILAFDSRSKRIREFTGDYSDYVQQLKIERRKQMEAFRDQQQEERRLKQDILRVKAQAEYTERQASSIRIGGEMMKLKGYKDYQQGIAKKVAKKAKARERKLDRFLDSEERVEKPRQEKKIRLDFSETEHLGRSVLTFTNLSVGYDEADPLLEGLYLEARPGARIVLTGPNGSGKSTLLRTVTGAIPPLAGDFEIGPSVKIGYMTQNQTDLDLESTPLRTLRHAFKNETETRTFLGYFLFSGEDPLMANSMLSFGQRARLSLAQLVVSGCNVLLLDEPINHLDIPARERFEEALSAFSGTIIAVIHDRYFIDNFASEIWRVSAHGLQHIIC